jgi:hypothetical protein
MNLTRLAHVLRAASEISGEKTCVLIGSQAVLHVLEQRLSMLDHPNIPVAQLIEWAPRRAREAAVRP